MNIRSFCLAAAVLPSVWMAACTAVGVDRSAGTPAEVVALVEGEPITLAELDLAIASKLHDLRAKALEALIEERVLEREAQQRGTSVEELVAAIAAEAPPVTDEAVVAFFEQNKARIPPGATLGAIGPQIRELLEEARSKEAIESLVDGADVVIHLAPPRIEVAAIGPALGPADAAVTIIEFSDYQCPYCARAEAVLQEVRKLYPEDVRLVYRHLPLAFHAQARPASIAAVCADEQDRFWDYHAEIFANQRTLDAEVLARIADDLGLDRPAFDACLVGAVAAERVDLDLRDAAAVGATGTPTFNVNGIQWSGTRSLEAMVELIEQELARSRVAGG